MKNPVIAKLREGRTSVGSWIAIGHPFISFLLLGENLGLPFFGGMALTFLGIKLAQE